MRGGFEKARARVAHAKTIYQELGLQTGSVDICGRVLATVEMLAGNPEVSERALRESCELARHLGQKSLLATRAGELAAVMYALREYDEAARWVQLARDSAGADDLDAALSWQPVQALLLARRGRLGEADRLAREALESARTTDSLIRQGDSLMVLAAVLPPAHRREAERLTREAVVLYERKGNLVAAERARALLPSVTVPE
jgi:hypothetical protein